LLGRSAFQFIQESSSAPKGGLTAAAEVRGRQRHCSLARALDLLQYNSVDTGSVDWPKARAEIKPEAFAATSTRILGGVVDIPAPFSAAFRQDAQVAG
jgi:hypothetical protein